MMILNMKSLVGTLFSKILTNLVLFFNILSLFCCYLNKIKNIKLNTGMKLKFDKNDENILFNLIIEIIF